MMKRLFSLLLLGLLFFAPAPAQNNTGPESSTFGLDEKDAAAVREIRYRMAQIRKSRPTVALVLSGGGAKGAATVGVLKYLEQYDFPVDMVVGTSIGGLVGAMYALGYNADYLDSLFRNMDWGLALSDKVDRRYIPYSRIRYKEKYLLSFPFYYRQDDYLNFLKGDMPFAAGDNRQLRLGASEEGMSGIARNNLLGSLPSGFVFGQNVNQIITSRTVGYSDSTNFFKMPTPFVCVATDMVSGKAKVWHDGSLNLAMRSTMSIPGLFAPVRTDGMVLVDGGMRNNFPVNVARRMGADIVIGVDLSDAAPAADEVNNLADIMMSMMNLFDDDAFNANVRNVDIHIHPDLSGYNMLSFDPVAVDTMYARGYREAGRMKPQLDALRKRLGKARRELQARKAVDIGSRDVLVSEVEIVGVDDKEAAYIRDKMFVKPGMRVGKAEIEADVATIFGKGSYDYVNYELRGHLEPYRLRILCKRGPRHQIGFGARIDTEDLVSLLLNVGLNTHAMQGHSLDLSARISAHPFVEALYSYNAPRFATFNVRATLRYTANSAFILKEGRYNMDFLSTHQELYFSNMRWSQWDVRLGLRNRVSKIFNIIDVGEDGMSYYKSPSKVEDYPGAFMEARVESLDNGYFPTRGVSAGLSAEGITSMLVPGSGKNWSLALAADGKFPFSFGRFTLIPQASMRFVLGNDVPVLFGNVLGPDFAGRYIEQQLPFLGLNDCVVVRDHLSMLRMDARVRLWKNHYISAAGNAAYTFNGFDRIEDGEFLFGAGIGYAYNSIAGPFKAVLHWSNITKYVGLYLSFGYHF